MIIDGKQLSAKLKEQMAEQVVELKAKYGRVPSLAVILVGENPASQSYVRGKIKAAEEVGIKSELITMPAEISEEALLAEIDRLNADALIDGVLVQLPLPKHINEERVIDAIAFEKDVDGFHPANVANLWLGKPCIVPCTPKGIMQMIAECGFDVAGKKAVVVGRSNIVGKPLAAMMTAADATVTLCHSKSKLSHHLYSADLIVTAVGKAGFLNCYPIHVPVIDVGINFDENGKLVGDCFNTEGRDVTPVPGGVGLLTRCALLDNVIEAKARKCLKRG